MQLLLRKKIKLKTIKSRILEGEKLTTNLLSALYEEIDQETSFSTFTHMTRQENKDGKTSYQVLADRIHKLCDLENIIDIGCGQGDFSPLIEGRYKGKYLGVDISETEIQKARTKYSSSKKSFLALDVTEVRIADVDRFDLAVSHMFLHMCADLRAVLLSVYDILKPNSAFISVVRRYDASEDVLKKLRNITLSFIKDRYPNFSWNFVNPIIGDTPAAKDLVQSLGFAYSHEDFELFQVGSPYNVSAGLLEMYPACILAEREQLELKLHLDDFISSARQEELVFPMRMMTLLK